MASLHRLDGGVAHIEMTERLNILNVAMIARLNELLDLVEESPEGPLALVLSSANPKLFSAGLDLKVLLNASDDDRTLYLASFIGLVRRLITLQCPTVAVVKGKCLAGGVFLMLGCDYRVATDDSNTYFHLNEVENGLIFTPGLADLVQGRIESEALRSRAGAYGMKILPDEALRGGMIQKIAPADHAAALALGVASAKVWAVKASSSMHRTAMHSIKESICATSLKSKL